MDQELIECEFLIPIRRDKNLSDGKLHEPSAWTWLEDEIEKRFGGGSKASVLYEGFYIDRDTRERVNDHSRRYSIAIARDASERMISLLQKACKVFHQKCIYISVAGRVGFAEPAEEDEESSMPVEPVWLGDLWISDELSHKSINDPAQVRVYGSPKRIVEAIAETLRLHSWMLSCHANVYFEEAPQYKTTKATHWIGGRIPLCQWRDFFESGVHPMEAIDSIASAYLIDWDDD